MPPWNRSKGEQKPGDAIMQLLHSSSESSNSESDDAECPEILMDQLGQDRFRKEVFLEQLLLHLFSPLCIPFYLAAGKSKLLASTSLWPMKTGYDFFWSLLPLMHFVNVLLFVLYIDKFREANVNESEIIFLPIGALAVHRSMIALKYSALSEVEYSRWCRAPTHIAKKWSKQLQLLNTWLPLPDAVLQMEVQKACRMQDAKLDTLYFQHDVTDEVSWKLWKIWDQMSYCSTEQLDGEMPCQRQAEDGRAMCRGIHKISATKVLLILWRMASDHVAMIPRVRIIGFWALFPSLAPIAWRAIASGATEWSGDVLLDALGAHPAVIYAVVTSFFVCYLQCFLAGLFAVMGIVHYKRVKLVLCSVARLARPLFCLYPNLPQAQLSGSVGVQNIRSVVACFEVTLRLGGRYQSRVESYIATLAIASFVGMGMVLIGVIVGAHTQMNAFTIVILSLVSGFTGVMFQMVHCGSKANETFGYLANNICRARWRNSAEQGDEACEQVMSLAMERLAILADTEPVTIAGTVPTCDLGYSLLSVVGTLILFVIGKLYNWDIPA